jgi:hypothetical protein
MLKGLVLCIAILAAMPLWSQVDPSASGGSVTLDDTRMMTPAPINGGVYPNDVGAETRSNFLSGGMVITGAYNDNLLVGGFANKISDSNYSIVPTISIDRRTPRQTERLNYNSGFTFYQKTTALNGITQSGSAEYRLHLTPYAVLSIRDSFQQNFNLFNQTNPFSASGASIGAAPISGYVLPFENQIGNSLDGSVEYQYGKNAMIGGSGTYTLLRYSDLSKNPGLDDSNVGRASAFINRRIARGQYLGAIYEYSRINTHPVQTTTNAHAISGFYTKYLTSTVSISVKGGPQRYSSRDEISGISFESWTPSVQGSLGYQTARTNFVADYSRQVSGSEGLIGAYLSNVADFRAQRQITRAWSFGVSCDYALFKNVTPAVSSANPGGHTLTGTASVQHIFSQRFRAEIGYSRIHQSYASLSAGSQFDPDCNREYASVTYQFSRPLGR